LTLLPWLGLGASVQAATVGATDGVASGFGFAQRVEVLRAPAGTLPASEVLAGRHDASFTALAANDAASLKCTAGIECWARFTLSRSADAPADWWLRVRAVRPGGVTLHAPDAAGANTAGRAGRQFPLSWRFVSQDLFFPVQLPASPATYYLHLQDTLGVDGFQLLQNSGFERQQRQLGTCLSVSAGATFALLMLNLVFWKWLRDSLFLHFALVMLAALLLHAWQIVPSMWEPEQVGDMGLRAVLQALFQASTALFVSRLFEFRHHLPRAARTANGFVALNLLNAVLALAGYHAAIEPWMAVLELAALAGTIGIAGWLLFVKRQWQFAWPAALMLLLALSSLIGRLRWMGLLDAGPDEGLGPTWTAVRLTYMLLLAIIVADRTRRAETQLRQTRHRALDEAQRAERLLEDKVQQRTLELFRSNALLAEEIGRRRQAEASLEAALASERKALQQQRQFVSLVSHEFRTPLAVIDAAAQSIELPKVEIPPRVAKIRRAVQRLTQLVVNCLAEDRLHGERPQLKAETIDLRRLVEGLIAPLGPLEQARIRLHLPHGGAWVHGDPALLEIALHNLVQNAIKYSAPDRHVDIHVTVQEHLACVDVEDRGDGIPAHEQPHIFERFFRGTGARIAGGTGLGLFLGAEIARAHSGSLVLVRSNPAGSVFRFLLPVVPVVPGH